ncbi:THUMP-like domain-containing protein [Dyadobacter sandarakinus]|uniref:THUMP-like domain-containing protein n=1 Tax=Dyadobacter sandarakinus TaxID=2747268 RepID=A0ABX7I7R3_9BACT|nr:hypothetical protein [Dyadobacter sandarakinus]QRR01768.1 hypothetical protein HWI92_13040 [Dyadobacter sandarakinus]
MEKDQQGHEIHQQGPDLTQEEVAFIQAHLRDDPGQLVLRAAQFKGLDVRKLAAQILSRQKAVRKLPEWTARPELVFPPPLSVEQCSSEATARYKASLVSGNVLTDLTGGMGIDCFYMGQKLRTVHYFEQQEQVARTAAFNFGVLGATHIQVHATDAMQAMGHGSLPSSDWIFADPARRDANKNKVVLLRDCEPDMTVAVPSLFRFAPKILVKTSPLLDIDQAVADLRFVTEVHVIGYEQECKELLFVLEEDAPASELTIRARVINAEGAVMHEVCFDRQAERETAVSFSGPQQYLYEPHAAVLKSGAFRTVAATFDVKKLALNSHLYTSEQLQSGFPGRIFEVVAVCKPDMKEIARIMGGDKANLTTRNFPAKTEDLRKKWKLKEGGAFYLFATTLSDQSKVVIVTRKAGF